VTTGTPNVANTIPDEIIDSELPSIVDEALAEAEIQTRLADPRLKLTEDDLREHAFANREQLRGVARLPLSPGTVVRMRWTRNRGRWPRRSITVEHLANGPNPVWRDAVRVNGVLPLCRTLINERMAPLLWASMAVRETTGLDRVRDRRFIVETASTKRFLDTVEQIHSGAIGIAGSRGVGKTTVIESYLMNRAFNQTAIAVPAPVQYDAREFVLHLFAELCQAVINPVNETTLFARWEDRRLAALCKRWLALTVLGLLASVAAAVIAVGPDVLLDHFDHIGQHLPAPWLALWPAGLLALCTLAPLAALLGTLTLLVGRMSESLLRPLRWLVRRPDPDPQPPLVDLAKRRLARIRFLQTRTTGWSGKLTMPMSTEVGLSKSTQRAEQPLTYPEIVHELRGFIQAIANQSPGVIVAIDELDKIEDAEQAQRFINEIKGIFGVEGARFLVSVSEEALASFERRGVSVRDAFDSAFDEIVRIEPLNLADACTLLNSRVIGLSDLFSCLAHCMAGGLARDIIRTARSMRSVAARDGDGIGPVAIGLVRADIASKVHAFQQAASNELDAIEFIRTLRGLRAEPANLLNALPVLWAQQQAATYVYHCATILEVFNDGLTKEQFDERRHILDTLAAAKQEIGKHPQLAWLMVDEFREAWGLPIAPTE
jgi:hypothetical protein